MKRIIEGPAFEGLDSLEAGDVIWLNGRVVTVRDVGYRLIVEKNEEMPVDLSGTAVFHAGPIVRKMSGRWELISIGPTTSMRMEKFSYEFIRRTKAKIIIGKGGMGEETERACIQFGSIHCIYPGGCAVLCARQVERIEEVKWENLGMPEAMYVMKVREFGPLIVSIDTKGNNLIRERKKILKSKMERSIQKVLDFVKDMA